VPGGNYLEGNTFADRFNWSETIGPVENRPGHMNSAWGYWSTDGGVGRVSADSEEMGAVSLAVSPRMEPQTQGHARQRRHRRRERTALRPRPHFHFLGSPRANGHPEPYDVNYVEIGNEDWFSSTYPTRYPLFYDAIGRFAQDYCQHRHGRAAVRCLDDHFYNTPQWFAANSDYYDDAPRGSYKILVGEYSAREGAPTGTMAAALGEAAFLMGLERNSDLVTMSAYAPLWVNVNGYQWTPDLIGYNNTTSYASPSYYVQKMLSQNRGTTVVDGTLSGPVGVQVLVTRTDSTYYLTVVNTAGTDKPTAINLMGALTVSSTATATTLSANSAAAVNSIANPTNLVPVESVVTGVDANYTYTFLANSLTTLEFTATVDTPTVATHAEASPATVTGVSTDHRARRRIGQRGQPRLHLVGDGPRP
jgi:alpha-N-arabinofuranosidase